MNFGVLWQFQRPRGAAQQDQSGKVKSATGVEPGIYGEGLGEGLVYQKDTDESSPQMPLPVMVVTIVIVMGLPVVSVFLRHLFGS